MHKRGQRYWIIVALGMIGVFVIAFLIKENMGGGDEPSPNGDGGHYAVAKADYPELSPYPYYEDDYDEEAVTAWEKGQEQLAVDGGSYGQSYQAFLEEDISKVISETFEEGENGVLSPLSIYLATSMLAEVTAGNSQKQLLDLLKTGTIEDLRENAKNLWLTNYQDDGRYTSLLANSIWTREGSNYNQETLQRITDNYYASIFSGDTTDPAYSQALRDWINENTGGLLNEQAEGIELKPETVMALVSTIYFNANWSNIFYEENTEDKEFHAEDQTVTVPFMHETNPSASYLQAEKFTATGKSLESMGQMWFILPNEGVDAKALLADPSIYKVGSHDQETKTAKVNLALPKFDVDFSAGLIDSLEHLGVTDIFDPALSDFSPMGDFDELIVSEFTHAARTKVDELGVEAAAFTFIAVAETSMPLELEQVDFILDRPFIFLLTNREGLITFVGLVNNPE